MVSLWLCSGVADGSLGLLLCIVVAGGQPLAL